MDKRRLSERDICTRFIIPAVRKAGWDGMSQIREEGRIIGRGPRVHEDTRKFHFTLIDFRGATTHFAEPDFDGEPVQIYQPRDDDPMTTPFTEQHHIVARVDEPMVLRDQLEMALTAADTTRTRLLEALLHEALTLTPIAQAVTEAAE